MIIIQIHSPDKSIHPLYVYYTCTKCAIYSQDIQSDSMMEIEIYIHRKYIVLTLSSVKIHKFIN